MRIAIIAPGSQGDVQPYIALGKGLKKAGNVVRLLTHENFKELVSAHELEFYPAKGNVQDVVQSKEMREALDTGNFLTITLQMAKLGGQNVAIDWAEQGLAACQGMDMVLAGMGGLSLGLSLAEKLGIPLLQAYVVPFTPTKAFPSVLLPKSLTRLGSSFNRLSHHLSRQFIWQPIRSGDKLAREVLDLPPAPFWGPYNAEHLQDYPILYGFSPSVIPKPSDWDNNVHVTGYWFLDSGTNWTPPPALIEFLESGIPPVYIGFGSMSHRNPEETVNLCLKALAQTEQRAVMLSGWGGLCHDNLPNTVFMIDSIPHSWLFSRIAAVVHHGGAGTTAAGLRAGVPSIIIPFFGDQLFWGQRIAELGVGPEPIPRKKLTVELLAKAIQKAMTDQTMRQRAANLGLKIQAEDGIAKAIAVVQDIK
jgi:sterol 3beta-glucosyltransferase